MQFSVMVNEYIDRPFIFVTSTLGGRGLDFPLSKNAFVLVASPWRSVGVLLN